MSTNSSAFIKHFPGHHIFVSMIEDSSKPPMHHHNGYKATEPILKERNGGEWNHGVFFTVNELDEDLDPGKHRTKKMVIRCRSVFMDDDNPRDKAREDFPLSPSLVVQSSPGKYHYYWLIDGGTDDKDTWNMIQRALMVRYDGDKQAKDITRYLRLPGYNHNKRDAFMVEYTGKGKKYSWGEICEAFPPIEAGEVKDEKGNIASIDQEVQSANDLVGIITTAGDGLHGAINKFMLGCKRDGMAKATAIAVVQGMGSAVMGKDDRTANRYSSEELERSWDGAEDEEVVVPEINGEKIPQGKMPWPPGLFGKLAHTAFDMARFQYDEVAIISAIGLVAGICGRKFNAEGAGLNVYATLIMDTGMGKDSINQFITTALNTANDVGTGSSFIGPSRFTGPKAVFNSLESARSQVCVFTEAGLLLNSKSGDGDGLKRVLLGLYTKSGKNHYSGTEMYSDAEKGVKSLRAPALSIINESTPEMLLSVFKKGDGLRTGDIPRQLIYRIIGEKPSANRKAYLNTISSECLDKIKHLIAKCSSVQAVDDPSAWDMIPDDGVEEDMINCEEYYLRVQNENRQDNTTRYAMSTRAYYKAVRLAAIASVFNHYDTQIHMEEWLWAKEMIAHEMNGLSHFFQGGMGDPMMDLVSRYGIPTISKILNEKLNIRSGMSRKDHKAGKFKLYEFTQALKNCQEINDLADKQGFKLQSGQQKLLDYMIGNDMLSKLQNVRAIAYQVTDTFLASCID